MNRLASEKSPYLLQHKTNPVDWFPWGDEAFEKARRENKPVFLSVGYSTCHWCHVMEHESFEDPEAAAALNAAFVNIKVDREERPDIDHIYMTVCQMMTRSGGWPLTVIMTPDRKPFFAGTYFPKETRFGRIGLMDLIKRIQDIWKNQNAQVLETAAQVTEALKQRVPEKAEDLAAKDLTQTLELMKSHFDQTWGGFGDAPKFPTPHNLMSLLRLWNREKDPAALKMVESTLSAMREGGIFDHVGFGFHRYSVDREWLVPHFEKMLYDQALLAYTYLETYQATGNEAYAETAREIFAYVLRDLKDAGGAFSSAEDADSEGHEGKFYVWNWKELSQILDPEELDIVATQWGAGARGNFEDMGKPSPDNILHMKTGAFLNPKVDMEAIREKLFRARSQRVRPHLDDKILADWNGLENVVALHLY